MNTKIEKVIIRYEKGLHIRVAAMIVHRADEIQNEYNVTFKIKIGTYNDVPLTSILLVTALKIKKYDEFSLITIGEEVDEASKEMKNYLESDFSMDTENISKVDTLLQDNMITSSNIHNAIDNGLIVVDNRQTIIVFNKGIEKLMGISAQQALGQHVHNIFPNSKVEKVLKTKENFPPYLTVIGKHDVMVTTSPIIEKDQVLGVICVLDDISKLVNISWELDEIKELKEKYLRILETVQDGICLYNQKGIVTYVNKAHKQITGNEIAEGDNLNLISPKGNRISVIETGKKINGVISHKNNGTTVIAYITPIIVRDYIVGGISVIKDITEIESLMETVNHLSAKAEYLEEELNRRNKLDPAFNRIIGTSSKLYNAMKIASKTSNNNLNVLIRGESGTGKELIAEAIHYSSKRMDKPFVRVNCAAIPANLLESEMFGHIKGAYTGAIKTKMGKFELANGGTIFLDEIGELDKSMQAKMLRAIQKKEFQRVGGEKTITVDVRIVAATNRDLEKLVKTGEFREDLYYRLNVIPIWLPSLRERKEDIPILLEHFFNKIANNLGDKPKIISKNALQKLVNYDWPGNIRELENIVERLVVLSDKDVVGIDSLPNYIIDNKISRLELSHNNNEELNNLDIDEMIGNEDIKSWDAYEKLIIENAMRKYKSFNAAGKALGISHKTVASKVRKYNIRYEE
ncbi:MAG: sigma 54-interacting transcriptional regulator [Vallitalea sp.]|jgi:PAS domain S-box-containing protein|nr:sigma 54-interacting transcriptional regulator [Vallitalea sp.]